MRKRTILQNLSRTAANRATVLFSCGWIFLPLFPNTSSPREVAPISSFTTTFDESKVARTQNIFLACKYLGKYVLPPRSTFSFNKAVGERSKQRGFHEAAVIQNGEFVLGMGGGVCQVSTTLYNAALRAGMKITEVHAHSLQVSYVPPSADAMVSEWCDLKFYNPFPTPIAIRVKATGNAITACIYGRDRGYSYKLKSEVTETIPPPPAEVAEGEEDAILRVAKEGIKSRLKVLTFRHGCLVSEKIVRRNSYAAVAERRVERRTDNMMDESFIEVKTENDENF